MQFHPFGLIEPDHAAGMPLSDGARHAGGVLLNNLGERFMTRYDPERMELSAQETVARASYTEIQEGRGSRSGGVWLDLSHLPGDTVLARLPHSPAATRAAEADVLRLMAADGDHHARALQRAVRRLITNHAGVVRDKAGPVAGLTALDEIEARTADTGVHIDIGGFSDLAHAYDLRSAVLAARATLQCARVRLCPQGCHHRSGRPGAAPALQDAMVWSATTGVRRTSLWPAPTGITVPWRDASDDAGPTV
ncbi:FAD-binding protein [Streptomyces sp. NPDC101234]|uniref:FAD-binding protein n=1 Tax=Streptomyces sp. NPDC101234 TaxID=3366138 RepID=UPI003802C8BF